ncbi:hypothetical protein [Nitrospira moscoviensis]|uniref:Lipoprotein n=1 Tax=Nitrospira moscoviensis TaxID=42253 RepID=A0A0K2G8Z2_NITMO|nr:hypothetical protein [Nitrospira moscoviensis]ALA57431.1 conserved exported protein of unknown function [Nitrospira moscoviensis]
MRRTFLAALFAGAGLLGAACNSGAPEPASVEIPSTGLRLTIVRIATDPFLPRHNLTLSIQGPGGCVASADLFPDTGYAGRRNIYLAGRGQVYVVGQFDARVIEPASCRITLSEFRHLDREVVFIGSFDENEEKRWTYFPAALRPEQPLASR